MTDRQHPAALCFAHDAASVGFTTNGQPSLKTVGSLPRMPPPSITPEQMRAARRLVGWSREYLAGRSETTTTLITAYENAGRVMRMLSRNRPLHPFVSIRTALEAAGIEFTNGGQPGVKLKRKDESNVCEPNQKTASITLTAAQVALIDQFQRDGVLASRDAAVALLLDVAFEAVTGRGRRFWDKSVVATVDPE